MAKTQKNTVKTEASKTPSSKADFVEETDVDTVPSSETDPIKVAEVQKEASATLAVATSTLFASLLAAVLPPNVPSIDSNLGSHRCADLEARLSTFQKRSKPVLTRS